MRAKSSEISSTVVEPKFKANAFVKMKDAMFEAQEKRTMRKQIEGRSSSWLP